MADNPFGNWRRYRAQIAAMSRSDARNPEAELEARQLLKASRLADAIIKGRDDLTEEQRQRLARIIRGEE